MNQGIQYLQVLSPGLTDRNRNEPRSARGHHHTEAGHHAVSHPSSLQNFCHLVINLGIKFNQPRPGQPTGTIPMARARVQHPRPVFKWGGSLRLGPWHQYYVTFQSVPVIMIMIMTAEPEMQEQTIHSVDSVPTRPALRLVPGAGLGGRVAVTAGSVCNCDWREKFKSGGMQSSRGLT